MAVTVPPRRDVEPRPGDVRPATTRLDRAPHIEHRPRRGSRLDTLESVAVFLVFGAVYFAVGYKLLTTNNLVVFDAVDRLTRAFMVFWDAPPKLAAIGFTFPPLESMVMLPFAVVKPLATSLIALPLMSAVFGGGTIAFVSMALKRCEMPALLRYPLLLVFAVNPLFGFYATNGMADMAALFFLAFGIYCAIAWGDDRSTLYLIGAGAAIALGVLTHYGIIAFAVALALMFTSSLNQEDREPSRVEATVVTFLMPVIYALALWTLLNALIVNSPFGWISSGNNGLAVNANQTQMSGSGGLGDIIGRVWEVVFHVSPLAIVLIPVLIVVSFAGNDGRALRAALLTLLAILVVGAQAVFSDEVGRVLLRNGLPVALIALLMAASTYRTSEGLRIPIYAVTIALLVLSIPLSWSAMKSYPFQNQEQAFTRALTSSTDLTGQSSRGGYTIGLSSERSMAAYIKRIVGKDKYAVLADNAQTYPVILLTGRPAIFRDRVQRGDSYFSRLVDDPFGKVRYLLISSQTRADIIRTKYPRAASGGQPGLTVVFSTDRYTLVRVDRRRPARGARTATQQQEAQAQRSRNFTPNQPPTVSSDDPDLVDRGGTPGVSRGTSSSSGSSSSGSTSGSSGSGSTQSRSSSGSTSSGGSSDGSSDSESLGTTVPQGATTTTTPQTRTTP